MSESETTINEKQDSIKVSRNSRGYTWELKRYYDYSETKPEEVIDQLTEINKQLRAQFGGGASVE